MTSASLASLLSPGANGLPRLALSAPDGARAEIYQHGAHLTSWIPAGGEERLFLSSRSKFDLLSTIRGGVPVIFPQFGDEGPLPKHGFARHMEWELLSVDAGPAGASARFGLHDDPASRLAWPHAFGCELEVTVAGQMLEMTLSVANPGPRAFNFTGGLHTYLSVKDIQDTTLEGLYRAAYLDTVGTRTERIQPEELLAVRGEVDRIYHSAPPRLLLHQPGQTLAIETEGYGQVVVWNPWIEKNAALGDMPDEGYRHMLCVEATISGVPVTVQPGQRWSGVQRLRA
jgi:glucose-6-phosphate 1-epimerase